MLPVRHNRNQTDAFGEAIQPTDRWLRDSRQATRDLIVSGPPDEFSVTYKSETVKMCLEKLFHLKCAYCEEKVTHGYDVEHFRPKAAVAEDASHPGYYWLAYEYDNLLPSCAPCNQARCDPPTWDNRSKQEAAGKLTQFPVAGTRARQPRDNLAMEDPLLLHPCEEDPTAHLACDPTSGALLPLHSSIRGKRTIEILNLNRKRLQNERKETAQRLRASMLRDSPEAVRENFLGPQLRFAGFCRMIFNRPALFGLAEVVPSGPHAPGFVEA